MPGCCAALSSSKMELNSPRTNPYSDLEHTKEKLRQEGFEEVFTVINEETASDEKGRKYKAKELQVMFLHRFLRKNGKDVFLNDEAAQREPLVLLGLQAQNGIRGLLIIRQRRENAAVEQAFAARIEAARPL